MDPLMSPFLDYLLLSNSSDGGVLPILKDICQRNGIMRGIVWSHEPSTRCLAIAAVTGYSIPEINNFSRISLEQLAPPPTSIAAKAFLANRTILCDAADPNYIAFSAEVTHSLSVPISDGTKPVGVLTLEKSHLDKSLDELATSADLLQQYGRFLRTSFAMRYMSHIKFEDYLSSLQKENDALSTRDCVKWLQQNLGVDFCSLYLRSKQNVLLVDAACENGQDVTDTFSTIEHHLDEDLIGWVAAKKTALSLLDVSQEHSNEYSWYEKLTGKRPRWTDKRRKGASYNFMALPIFDSSKVIGVLRFSNNAIASKASGTDFSYLDEKVLRLIAERISSLVISIKRKRSVAQAFAGSWLIKQDLNFKSLIEKTLGAILESTNATDAYLILRDMHSSELHVYSPGSIDETTPVVDPKREGTILHEVFESRKGLSGDSSSVGGLGEALFDAFVPNGATSVRAIPLLLSSGSDGFEVIGMLAVYSIIEHAFTEEDDWVLTTLTEKLLDSYQVINLRIELGKKQKDTSIWQHAARTGILASGELHEARRRLDSLNKKARELSEFESWRKNPEQHAILVQVKRDLEDLKGRFDRVRNNIAGIESAFIEVDFDRLIQKVIDDLMDLVRSRHVKVLTELSGANVTVECDDLEMRSVLNNLVVNSIQANARKISIRSGVDQEAGQLEVSVTDDGRGLPKGDWQEAFSPLYSVGKKRTEGTGLGLWVCREILKHHSGKIAFVESAPFQRTVVTFSMPLRQEE